MQLQFSHLCSAAYDLVSSDMLPAQNNDDVWVFMRDLPPSNVYGAEPLMRMIDKARRPWVGQCSYDPETRLVGVLILWDQLPPELKNTQQWDDFAATLQPYWDGSAGS